MRHKHCIWIGHRKWRRLLQKTEVPAKHRSTIAACSVLFRMIAPILWGEAIWLSVSVYIDDSGSRAVYRDPREAKEKYDYFALGGLIIKDSDKESAKRAYNDFCER